tara:strand:+ start:433 stop:558 length:126 start_codon:yes stop_codon:yes gene_type:complete
MNKIDSIIEKIIEVLDSDGFTAFIILFAIIGLGIQIIRALI